MFDWMPRATIAGLLSLALLQGCTTSSDKAHEGCVAGPSTLPHDVISEAQKPMKGNVQRGETLFTSLCSGCHVHGRLSNLAQSIRSATTSGAPVPPHLSCERFQYANSEAYLAATIKYGGRPEFQAHSMPAWQGVLNDEDIADLVAYIVSIGDITPPSQ
jgi:mono/diheme cytochrome c family protein